MDTLKHLLLIAALATGFSAVAQDSISPPVAPAFNRILLGLNASADYCNQTSEVISDGGATATPPWTDEDQPKFGYTVGLKVQYNFTRHWALGLGAQYANRGYASDRSYNWIMVDPVDPVIPKGVKTRYDHHFIDIPVRLIFQAGGKRVRFTASMGVAGNLLLNVSQVQKLEYVDGHVVGTRSDVGTTYRDVNLSVIGSMGAVYQFTERSSLQLEPRFLYNLYPINDRASKPTLWSAGADLTFFYALR